MSGQQYAQALQQVQGQYPQSVQNSPYVQPFQFSQVSSPWNSMSGQLNTLAKSVTPDYQKQLLAQASRDLQMQLQKDTKPAYKETR